MEYTAGAMATGQSLTEDRGMRELVGVRRRFGFVPSTIKRDALLFKRIAVAQDPDLAQEIKILIAEKLG